MSNIPSPERVIVSVNPPSSEALTKATTYVLGSLYEIPGQVFDPNSFTPHGALPQDNVWRGGFFAVETQSGLYYALPPSYRRSMALCHTGSILDVSATVRERSAVTIDTDSVLPTIEIGSSWQILPPDSGPVNQVMASATGDIYVIPDGSTIEEFDDLRRDKLCGFIDKILMATFGETPRSLAGKKNLALERAQDLERGRVSEAPDKIFAFDIEQPPVSFT